MGVLRLAVCSNVSCLVSRLISTALLPPSPAPLSSRNLVYSTPYFNCSDLFPTRVPEEKFLTENHSFYSFSLNPLPLYYL